MHLIPIHEEIGPVATASGCASGACQERGVARPGLAEEQRLRILDHPCYSEEAHHSFARMHLPVAPACNIQCHYCNRKYDCSNESRPGVVSAVLSPEDALRRTRTVAAAMPRLSVVGIAGPGDPLANPLRTFTTLRLLREQAPPLRLCISTNGLALPGAVDELVELGVEHVTITINCVDPEIGTRIYPWIFWNHRRVFGLAAARILLRQQLLGLDRLVARGVLVKVNSVLIPGVNDRHLPEVSRLIRDRGAFLHNVMPLISAAEHGTFFGRMGQREPRPEELQALQEACAGDMRLMRHCRQCRADAIGLLGEDRGAEFMQLPDVGRPELEPLMTPGPAVDLTEWRADRSVPRQQPVRMVRIAVASSGSGLVDQHFGHATNFLVYEVTASGVRLLERREVARYCAGSDACSDRHTLLDAAVVALRGCAAVLCARIGYEPWQSLEAAGIQPNGEHAHEPVEAALLAVFRELDTDDAVQDSGDRPATAVQQAG